MKIIKIMKAKPLLWYSVLSLLVGVGVMISTLIFGVGCGLEWSLLVFFLIYPVNAFMMSMRYASISAPLRWYPILFIILVAMPPITHQIVNRNAGWMHFWLAAIPAVIGLIIGIIIGFDRRRTEAKIRENENYFDQKSESDS